LKGLDNVDVEYPAPSRELLLFRASLLLKGSFATMAVMLGLEPGEVTRLLYPQSREDSCSLSLGGTPKGEYARLHFR